MKEEFKDNKGVIIIRKSNAMINHILSTEKGVRLGLWCLTSLSIIFQLFRGGQFYWWRKPEYPKQSPDMPQVTENLYHKVVWSTHCHERGSNSQL